MASKLRSGTEIPAGEPEIFWEDLLKRRHIRHWHSRSFFFSVELSLWSAFRRPMPKNSSRDISFGMRKTSHQSRRDSHMAQAWTAPPDAPSRSQ